MRFLNITIDIPGKIEKKKLSFTGETNIISSPDPQKISLLSQIPSIVLYGKGYNGEEPSEIFGAENHTIQIEAQINDRTFIQTCNNNKLQKSDEENYSLFNFDDFKLYSLSGFEHPDKLTDPVFDVKRIKEFFINRETSKGEEVLNLDESLIKKEKELNELRKKKQLLELKKIKKDKLKKEINSSEKEINKLIRKKESYQSYKKNLDEIYKMTQESSRLSTKINNLKKEIIDIRELHEKSNSIEKEISTRFPQFNKEMIEKIPDLDILQSQFNTIRDLNEEIDNYYSKNLTEKKNSLKTIAGLSLFASISILFLFIKSGKNNPGTTLAIGLLLAISLLSAISLAFYFYFVLMKKRPEELITKKAAAESSLLEIFKNSNFPVQNFATGELYEYLFQYFEDFLSFREMQSELSSIKKHFNLSSNLHEKEEKLESVIGQKEKIENDIINSLNALDINVHPVPQVNQIHNLLPEIDEIIADIEKEITHKSSINEKIGHEAKQYESGIMQDSVLDNMIYDIDSYIKKTQTEIEEIKLLKQDFSEGSESWFTEKLKTLIDKSSEFYIRITSHKENKEKISSLILNLLNNKEQNISSPEALKIIELSLRLSLSEIINSNMNPPLILKEPLKFHGDEIVSNIKKILLELSDKRQVLIITSADTTDLAGNLINI